MTPNKPDYWPAGRPYLAGDFYSFRTSPATEFSSKETGRFAALKVIGFKDKALCIAVLDGIFGERDERRGHGVPAAIVGKAAAHLTEPDMP